MKALNVLLTLVALFAVGEAWAQDSLGISKIGSIYKYLGRANDVAVSGQYVYVATNDGAFRSSERGLRVLDFTDPEHPIEVGSCATSGPATAVTLSHDSEYAYVIDSYDGLRVFDIRDPVNPVEVYLYDPEEWHDNVSIGKKFEIMGDIGFLAYQYRNDAGFIVLDISSPRHPRRISTYRTRLYSIYGLAIDSTFVYVATRGTGLRIVDISDIWHPTEIANLLPQSGLFDCYAENNRLYIADASVLWIFDVTSPRFPREISVLDIGDWIYDIAKKENHLLLSGNFPEVKIIDVSDPEEPSEVASIRTNIDGNKSTVHDEFIYGADDYGIFVANISNPANPILVGSYRMPNRIGDHIFSGNYAYVSTGRTGVRIVDCSNVDTLKEVGSYLHPSAPPYYDPSASELAVEGNYLYILDLAEGLFITSISNPRRPRFLANYSVGAETRCFEVQGDYAYVSYNYDLMTILDVSDPAHPEAIGFHYDVTPYDIEIVENKAYLAAGDDGLHIVDISRPSEPRSLGGVDSPGFAQGIAVSGNIVFLADTEDGVRIIDASNPEQPVEINNIETAGDAISVRIEGNYAIVAVDSAGILIFDILNPANPQLTGFYDTMGKARNVEMGPGNKLYVSDTYSFGVYDVSAALSAPSGDFIPRPSSLILSLFPSPFNSSTTISFSLPGFGEAGLRVYDLQGRLVAELFNGRLEAGEHKVVWEAGGLPAGIYLIRLNDTAGNSITQKVLLMK